jgi:predicted nucleic acid-binding protein
MIVVYDASVLLAAERGNREVWADHRVRLEIGALPATTAPVIAQVSRSPRQVQLRTFLRGCDVVPFAAEKAHDVGALLGDAGTSDVVDAHIVHVAEKLGASVLTADVEDLSRLAGYTSGDIPIIAL